MKPGDQLRFRGPAGAPFVVTVGVGFDERTIRARIESGEWTPDEEPQPQQQAPRKRAAKKAAAKPKTDE
ncbi:hypothetical protein [Streptomyces hygroscopicus]|uniref:hypothetical protein n=1 Tax=Streptomyces hygroscopicus TaxID=1912 RepID=UPI0033DC73A7